MSRLDHLDWQRPALSEGQELYLEIASDEENVYIRQSDDLDHIVTTTRKKFDAWIKGAKAGEFDHFVA
ncbi:DUF397 domain-containing protein [Kitasatospora sp. NPDC051170]|uniref:DUF397 domain-containing protein n=1 Tax=Kitasatospora sp. NPDC051170 TaxID=3364056 RepID=UPI0037B669F7